MLLDFVGDKKIEIKSPPPVPFTFPDSGITVLVRRMSPDTMNLIGQAVRKSMPPPEPPQQEVEYPDGSKRMEKNESHPDYRNAMEVYVMEVAQEAANRMMRFIARRVEVEVDLEAVQTFREDMEAIGVTLEETDDKVVYVRHILVSSKEDYQALTNFIAQISQPTKEAVDAHKDSFRSDVSG